MEAIVYKNRRNTQTLTEADLTNQKAYNKFYYSNSKLRRVEYLNRGRVTGVDLHLQPSDAAESLLLDYLGVRNVTLYNNHFKAGRYDYCEVDYYQHFKLQYSIIEVRLEDELITQYFLYHESGSETNSKYFLLPASADTDKKERILIQYYASGEFKRAVSPGGDETNDFETLTALICSQDKTHPNNQFYESVFPLIPGMPMPLPNRAVRYYDTLNNECVTFRDALHTDYYKKEVYNNDILITIDEYMERRLEKRTHYLYTYKFSDESLASGAESTIHYNPQEINNYTVWDVDTYNETGELEERSREVWNHEGTKIAVQKCSLTSGEVIETEKYSKLFVDDTYGYKPFTYDTAGKICEVVTAYDFGYDTYHISEVEESGFFDDEYGRYFRTAAPLVPAIPGPAKVNRKVLFKNHYGKVIEESEIRHLYEYKKETYHNGFLKEVDCYGSGYITTEVYDDEAKEANLGRYDTCFYDLEKVYGYRIYRAAVRDSYSDLIFTGTLVQDIHGREVSRIIWALDKIQFARKIAYDCYIPNQQLYGGDTHVLYDEDGRVSQYREVSGNYNSIRNTGRTVFETRESYRYERVAHNYYQSIDELVPPFPFLSDTILTERKLTSYKYVSGGDRIVTGYYNSCGKLKHVVRDQFEKMYFLSKGENLSLALEALKPYSYQHYYFDIIDQDGFVFLQYFHLSGLHVQMKISKDTYIPTVRLSDDTRDVTLRLHSASDNQYWYSFYRGEDRIHFTHFHTVELAKQLLQAIG